MNDYNILREALDRIGIKYEANPRTNCYAGQKCRQEIIGFDLDLENSAGEFSFHFDLGGKFVETSLWYTR